MHSSKEIALVAGALANQLRAGLPMDQAVDRLSGLQPRRAEFWKQSGRAIGSGMPISKTLRGHWPTTFVAAIEAGEESGNIVSVFNQIDDTIRIESEIKGHTSKLLYPLAMAVGGMMIFVFFMSVVIPSLAKSFSSKKSGGSAIMNLSLWMESTVYQHGWTILGATAIAIYGLVLWIRSPEGREKVSELLSNTPILGPALNDLSFGVWAHYMSTMVASGIPTVQSLEKTIPVLPLSLQDVIQAAVEDMHRNRPLSEAFNAEKLPAGDPRKRLPFYISVAMRIAEDTGDIAEELTRVAPSLIKEGLGRLKIALYVLNLVGLAVASAAIATPMGAYYLQLFGSINHLG